MNRYFNSPGCPRIESFTLTASFAEWMRTGIWQLDEPFWHRADMIYKVKQIYFPPNGSLLVFVYDFKAEKCKLIAFSRDGTASQSSRWSHQSCQWRELWKNSLIGSRYINGLSHQWSLVSFISFIALPDHFGPQQSKTRLDLILSEWIAAVWASEAAQLRPVPPASAGLVLSKWLEPVPNIYLWVIAN